MSNIERTGLNPSGLPNEYSDDVINAVNSQWEDVKNVPMQKSERPTPVQEQPTNHEQRNSANHITAKGLLKPFLTGLLITGLTASGIAFTIHQDKLVNEEFKNSKNFKNATDLIQDQDRANAIEEAQNDFDNYNIDISKQP